MTDSGTGASDDRIALRIAVMMRMGTALASALLILGAILAAVGVRSAATVLLTGGCGVIIAIPIIRLVMMARCFIRLSDRRFTGVTAAVLALVIASGALGLIL